MAALDRTRTVMQLPGGSPVDVALDTASLAEEARRAARQEQWLRTRGVKK
jgi:hypothetical protein